MSADAANWAYAEDFVPEDKALLAARDAADHLGCVPVLPGAGRALQLFAAALGARTAVEIGTGAGVSLLYLLRGMVPDAVVTTIDVEAEHQKAAKETLKAGGFAPESARMITGRALDVLPRLADGGYDMVLIDARKKEYPQYLEQALRLVRVGGLIAIDNSLWHSRVPDPAQRDADHAQGRQGQRGARTRAARRRRWPAGGDANLVTRSAVCAT